MALCYDRFGRAYTCRSSAWYSWGRWVLFGAIVLGFILLFFCFSCITARRRRKLGRKPMYGTGWAAAGPMNSQPGYNPNYNQQQGAPQYNYNQQTPQGGYYGQNQGYGGGQNQSYFGGQQTGVEMPSQTYQPPSGPPPGKY